MSQWIENKKDDISDVSEGLDPSNDEENVLEIQNIVWSDVETDSDRDSHGHHDDDTGSHSLDDYEPIKTMMYVIDFLAAGNGIIRENTTGFYFSKDGSVCSDIALFSSCKGREQRRYYPSYKRDSVRSPHHRSTVRITPSSREVEGTVKIPISLLCGLSEGIRQHMERGFMACDDTPCIPM